MLAAPRISTVNAIGPTLVCRTSWMVSWEISPAICSRSILAMSCNLHHWLPRISRVNSKPSVCQLRQLHLPVRLNRRERGYWKGLDVYGGQQPANVQLDYVTVEYGGSGINGANISVVGGYLVAQHSIIRHSLHDGVYFGSAGRGSLSNSQIVSNTLYGVHNITPLRSVLAANNWWGVPSGPTSDVPACSQGTGDRVSDGVLFHPVLTDTNSTAPFPLSDAPVLTLTPRRWFAPADGISRASFSTSLCGMATARRCRVAGSE